MLYCLYHQELLTLRKGRIKMPLFCTIYFICSYSCVIPQIIKLIKTKSSNDYSLGMISIQLFGIICWSIYVFTSKQSIIVYFGTVIDLVLLIIVDLLILKYYKFKGGNKNEKRKR